MILTFLIYIYFGFLATSFDGPNRRRGKSRVSNLGYCSLSDSSKI